MKVTQNWFAQFVKVLYCKKYVIKLCKIYIYFNISATGRINFMEERHGNLDNSLF